MTETTRKFDIHNTCTLIIHTHKVSMIGVLSHHDNEGEDTQYV